MFSKWYESFNKWKTARSRTTRYAKGIIQKHKLFAKLTLGELRKARISDLIFSNKRWSDLTASEKRERNLALEVLRNMRKGETLRASSKNVGLSINSIKKHLGKSLFKKHGRWFVKNKDRIQRGMTIYKQRVGKISIAVTNSRDASIIGEYFSAVKQALKTGDSSHLKKFKKITIIDAKGKKHKLETNLDRLYEIDDEMEDVEFFEIYYDEA